MFQPYMTIIVLIAYMRDFTTYIILADAIMTAIFVMERSYIH